MCRAGTTKRPKTCLQRRFHSTKRGKNRKKVRSDRWFPFAVLDSSATRENLFLTTKSASLCSSSDCNKTFLGGAHKMSRKNYVKNRWNFSQRFLSATLFDLMNVWPLFYEMFRLWDRNSIETFDSRWLLTKFVACYFLIFNLMFWNLPNLKSFSFDEILTNFSFKVPMNFQFFIVIWQVLRSLLWRTKYETQPAIFKLRWELGENVENMFVYWKSFRSGEWIFHRENESRRTGKQQRKQMEWKCGGSLLE